MIALRKKAEDHVNGRLPLSNGEVASRLDRVAELLEAQDANPYRVRAYRTAADVLRRLDQPAAEILHRQGVSGLMVLSGIGQSLARAIEQLVFTGRLSLLERLEGWGDPERMLATVAGLGRRLAHRIHESLGIETLQDLEIAAYDGRLARLPGMGRKRIRTIRESLAGRFRRRPQIPERITPETVRDLPSVAELLDVDAEYRAKAKADRLLRIAPRRFNPTGIAWLPILHTQRGARHYTALYSNTARAHELGTTHDWVVIYRDDHKGDGQWTVVTARLGPLEGQRIVRGREAECAAHYDESQREHSERPRLS
jgi:hypothetical protein